MLPACAASAGKRSAAVEDGDTRPDVPEREDEVDLAVVDLDPHAASRRRHADAVREADTLGRIVRRGLDEERTELGEERALRRPRRPIARANGEIRRSGEGERAARGRQ